MLARHNDLFTTGGIAEDQMKINAIRVESQEVYERNLYKEAARRVVFSNCMTSCEIDPKTIPNFNKNFYYNQMQEQHCLENCYNTRMKLHFGSEAENQNMLISFDKLKTMYQGYENWNPQNRVIKNFMNSDTEKQAQNMTNKLIAKTQKERYSKFDF